MFAFNQIWLRSKCTKLRTYDFLKMYKLIKKVMCVSLILKNHYRHDTFLLIQLRLFKQKKCTGMNENRIRIFIYIDLDILRK